MDRIDATKIDWGAQNQGHNPRVVTITDYRDPRKPPLGDGLKCFPMGGPFAYDYEVVRGG